VRALGVSTKERVAALPHLSPIAEQGVIGFDAASWQMVVAPAAHAQGHRRAPAYRDQRIHAAGGDQGTCLQDGHAPH
jgi:hypothetical protein